MQTIIIELNSELLDNPSLDIIYQLPAYIEEVTEDKIYDNGYDYLDEHRIALWLACDNAEEDVKTVINILKSQEFSDNDLSKTAKVYWSTEDCAEIENAEQVIL